MTKIVVVPNETSDISSLIEVSDALILPIQDFSINYSCYFNVSDANRIILEMKKRNKEVFVSLNKNIHNSELMSVDKVLESLTLEFVSGILYSDVSFVTRDLPCPLVWAQEHLTTNYQTCEFWRQFSTDYVFLSGELTLDELLEINSKTELKTMVPVYGFLPMTTSYRTLSKNYMDHIGSSYDDEVHLLEQDNRYYPIIEQEQGTFILSQAVLNLYDEIQALIHSGVSYLVLNGTNLDEYFVRTVQLFQDKIDNLELGDSKVVDELTKYPTDKGFLYKETVYRVI